MSWSKIPIALRIAVVLNGIFIASALVATVVTTLEGIHAVFLFRYGCSFVVKGFALYGALELATLVRGRAVLGARLAAAGWAASLALALGQVAVSLSESWRESTTATMQWAWWAVMLAIGAGLVVAAARKPILAIAGGLLWLVSSARPPIVEQWLWKHALNDNALDIELYVAGFALQALAIALLAGAAVGDVPDGFAVRDPRRVRWGMTKIGGALWLRLLAMAVAPLVTMATLGDRDHGIEAIGYTTIGALAVNGIAMLGFGLGALDAARSHHPDLRRPAFYVAAGAALWCAGVMLYKVPQLHHELFTPPDAYADYRFDTARIIVEAFEYLVPLVMVAAVAAWTVGIDGFATRRERLDLAERAQRTAVLFIVLSFASFAVTKWLLPDARTDGTRALVMLVALICGAAALFNAARLASDTAELGDVVESQLPTATVV